MQLSTPRRCPSCNDGRKGGKLCRVCRGSGYVQIVPAEKPTTITRGPSFCEQMTKKEQDLYA